MTYSLNLTTIATTVLLLVTSCANNTTTTKEIPIIDIETGVQEGISANLSDYASSIEYIPLETNNNSLVGRIFPKNMRIDDNYMVFFENTSQQIKLFNNKGEYLRNIGTKGNTTGEYRAVNSLKINSDTRELIIQDYNKLILFNLDNGNFIKEIFLDSIKKGKASVVDFFTFDKGKYAILLQDFRETVASNAIIDQNGNILNFFTENPQKIEEKKIDEGYKEPTKAAEATMAFAMVKLSASYMYNNRLNLISLANDTVISLDKNYNRTPEYIFNFGKYKIAPDNSNQSTAIEISASQVLETNGAVFFNLRINKNKFNYNKEKAWINTAIYDKETKKTFCLKYDSNFDANGLTNDIDNGIPFWPIYVSGNKMYQTIDAYKFIELSKKSNSPKMKDVASKLTDESNSVVIIATIK